MADGETTAPEDIMDKVIPNAAALWSHALQHVRRTVASPMVWLAMQAACPIAVDGNYFVVGLSADKRYLADSLNGFEAVAAIEDALREEAGHILALRVIEGETAADWGAVRDQHVTEAAPAPPPTAAPGPTRAGPTRAEPARQVFENWDQLNDFLTHQYKTWPQVRHAHGQARYVLEAVKHISDTMDILMPGPGQPPDDAQERALARLLERLKGIINLDPIFLSLELFRYRQSQGK